MNFLPVYIDSELWDEFWLMRKKMGARAPVTEFAKSLILKELMKFYNEGYDANSSLEKSIMKGWRGVFPGNLRSDPKPALDPALQKIVNDSQRAAPMPDYIRQAAQRMTGKA
jgi:hypothetical protein